MKVYERRILEAEKDGAPHTVERGRRKSQEGAQAQRNGGNQERKLGRDDQDQLTGADQMRL